MNVKSMWRVPKLTFPDQMAPNELPEQVLSLSFLGVIHLLSPLAFPTYTDTPNPTPNAYILAFHKP